MKKGDLKMNKKIKLPKIGARTIKTGITVLLSSLISFLVLKRESAIIASISGVICLQNSVEGSVSTGKNRITGTIFGAIIGFVFASLSRYTNSNKFMISVIAGAGIIATIYLCILFSIQDCISTACVMFLIIMMSISESEWLSYSIMRTIDTFVGVFVGITVNKYVLKESFKKVQQD